MKEVLYKLDIIAPAVSLNVAVFIIAIRKGTRSFPDFILLTFIAAELLLNNISASLLAQKNYNNGIYLLNCITYHLVFTFYFLKVLSKKRIVYIGFTLFCLVTLYTALVTWTPVSFPSYPYAVSSFIIIIYSLYFLNQLINTLPAFDILSLKEFWVITGTLTYFGSTFFIFISYSYLSVSNKHVSVLWQLHNIFLCIGCFIFLKAIKCKKWIPK